MIMSEHFGAQNVPAMSTQLLYSCLFNSQGCVRQINYLRTPSAAQALASCHFVMHNMPYAKLATWNR